MLQVRSVRLLAQAKEWENDGWRRIVSCNCGFEAGELDRASGRLYGSGKGRMRRVDDVRTGVLTR